MNFPLKGRLWQHPDFLKLWAGETISQFGSQITQLAIPTVAILLLHATPIQVGLLGAFNFLAFPTLGLFAGVWSDRLRRRPIMIVADLGRMFSLASVPLAFSMSSLTLFQLYVVALVNGVCTVFFDISYQSYLPALIERSNLLEGNTKLEVSGSAARIAGPAVAGFLIQLVGAARAVLVDAASYLVSAIAILAIRKPEPTPQPSLAGRRPGFFHEMAEGLHVVLGNPILRRIVACTATFNLGSNMAFAVYLIFVYRQLGLGPDVVGIIFAISSVGFLAGAMVARRMARWFALGRTLALSSALGGFALLGVPLAQVLPPLAVLPLLALIGAVGIPIYNINQVSLRQAIVPDRLQGRMNATVRTIVWGTIPIGSFTGGLLGSQIGVPATILVGGSIAVLSSAWILLGPVIALKEQPVPVSV